MTEGETETERERERERETERQRETETERGGKGVASIVLSQIEDRLKVIWLWLVSCCFFGFWFIFLVLFLLA